MDSSHGSMSLRASAEKGGDGEGWLNGVGAGVRLIVCPPLRGLAVKVFIAAENRQDIGVPLRDMLFLSGNCDLAARATTTVAEQVTTLGAWRRPESGIRMIDATRQIALSAVPYWYIPISSDHPKRGVPTCCFRPALAHSPDHHITQSHQNLATAPHSKIKRMTETKASAGQFAN
jgi:hypothetical protein